MGRYVSHETARQWGFRGKKLYMTKKDSGPQCAALPHRGRLGAADVRSFSRRHKIPSTKVSILDVADHFKWIYRERARLIGTDFEQRRRTPRRRARSSPNPSFSDMVRRSAPAPEEIFSDPNGHR
jgi:hypothetical protein